MATKTPADIVKGYEKYLIAVTKDGPKEYLQTKHALMLLRELDAEAKLTTELLEHTRAEMRDKQFSGRNGSYTKSVPVGGYALFRARVQLSNGGCGEGHGSETSEDFPEYLEKAETKAVKRAMTAAGIGTQFGMADWEYEQDNPRAFKGALAEAQPPPEGPPPRSPDDPGPHIVVATPPVVASPTTRDLTAFYAASKDIGYTSTALATFLRNRYTKDTVEQLSDQEVADATAMMLTNKATRDARPADEAAQREQAREPQLDAPVDWRAQLTAAIATNDKAQIVGAMNRITAAKASTPELKKQFQGAISTL